MRISQPLLQAEPIPSTLPPIHTTGCDMTRDRLPPHVMCVTARGKTYYYLQRGRGTDQAAKRIRLPDPSSPDFWRTYGEAMGLAPQPVNANSFATLIAAYQASPDFRRLTPGTRAGYEHAHRMFLGWWGPLEVRGLEPKHVLRRRDELAGTWAKANNMLSALSALMAWSVPRGYRNDNPCEHVRKVPAPGDGYAPWPWELIQLAEREAPPWMWRAIALAVYTGQRQGDVLAMTWRAVKGSTIEVRQAKTGKELIIPVHARLRPILDAIPREAFPILTSTRGQPWTGDGFRASWRKGLPRPISEAGLVFHGLRKSAVVTLLEVGCTDAEVAAITGQSRQMVEHYSKAVNQRKLAAAAILKWERG
jgi:integrase